MFFFVLCSWYCLVLVLIGCKISYLVAHLFYLEVLVWYFPWIVRNWICVGVASSNMHLADLSVSLIKFRSSWCWSFICFSTEVILFSIPSNFTLISCFNSSKMTRVMLVGVTDPFHDEDEVLFVLFLGVMLILFLFWEYKSVLCLLGNVVVSDCLDFVGYSAKCIWR